MFERAMKLATLAAAAMILGACDPSVTSPLDGDPGITAAGIPAEGAIDLAVLDQPGGDGSLFEQLSREIPGFAGLWFDRRCNLHVVLTQPDAQGELATRVLTPFLRRYVQSHRCPDTAAIVLQKGEFDWIQLSRWLRSLGPAAGFPGVARLGISVPLNRIVVAVSGREPAHEVLRLAAHAGVPAAAIHFTLAPTDARQRDTARTRDRTGG